MEVRANQRPESEEALSMIQEEARTNDLTRFERFKKWAKENLEVSQPSPSPSPESSRRSSSLDETQ